MQTPTCMHKQQLCKLVTNITALQYGLIADLTVLLHRRHAYSHSCINLVYQDVNIGRLSVNMASSQSDR